MADDSSSAQKAFIHYNHYFYQHEMNAVIRHTISQSGALDQKSQLDEFRWKNISKNPDDLIVLL
jgi:hypothetical protein